MSSRLARPLLSLPLAAALAACGFYPTPAVTTVSVMTQDLGMGGDLEAVLAAAPADQPSKMDALWAQKDVASFAKRADLIAGGVAARGPDVIGVQSAMQWRRTTASGGEELVADYLDLLVSALQARGLSYTPVATVATADLTVAGGGGDVYRLTDREAILVRAGLATSAVTTGTFVAHRTVSIGGTPVAYPRGWVSVLADIGGKPLRVVSTHLDSVDPAAQRDQAAELLHVAGAGPVAVIGGLGADPADTRWAGYAIILAPATGFMDAVSSAGAAFPTCCRDAALVDPAAVLDRRMDFILASPELMGRSGSRVHGDAAAMVNGLWPSTHAGVVGQLEFR